MRSRAFASAVLSLALAACATRAVPPERSADRAAVERAMQEYGAALRGASADSVAAWYTSDGELLEPGMAPLRGRKAIRDFLAPLASAVEVESIALSTDLVDVHGDAAEQWGTYRQVAGERGKAKQTYTGRYAARWRHEPDGPWRLERLMMQPGPAE